MRISTFNRARRGTRRKRPLSLEALETRQLLASSISLNSQTGLLTIVGSPRNDLAQVDYVKTTSTVNGMTSTVTDMTKLQVRLQSDSSGAVLQAFFPTASVTSVVYSGQGGTDLLANQTTKAATWTTASGGVVNTSLVSGSPGSAYSAAVGKVGVFQVGPTGQVGVTNLRNGPASAGEVAIFSLQGMGNLTPGTPEFAKEAARRALTDSVLGHIVISAFDSAPKGKTDPVTTYQTMTPGDTFGVMMLPGGTIWSVYADAPGATGPRLLYSFPDATGAGGTKPFAIDPTSTTTWGLKLAGTAIKLTNVVANPATSALAPASFCGQAYIDLNGNGAADPADPSLPGVQVTISGVDFAGHAVSQTVSSNANGCFEFATLPAGNYRIVGQDPTGRTLVGGSQVGTNGGSTSGGSVSDITLLPGDKADGYALGRLRPSTIRGAVYNDGDRDRIFDASESGIVGVPIRLTGIDDLGSTVDLTTTTNLNGSYAFNGLRPGTYTVKETQPSGRVDGRESVGTFLGQAHPTSRNGATGNDRFSAVVLNPGEEGYNYNFGEWTSAADSPSYTAERNFSGTNGSDTVEILLGTTTHQVRINGVSTPVDATASTVLTFDGLGGNDSVTIVGIPGSEAMTIAPGLATLIAPRVRLEVNGASSVTFLGGAGDRVFLYDTAGDDRYTASPTSQTLDGPDYHATIQGVDRVYAYATAGGTDSALLSGSAGDDTFKATPGDARLYGNGFYNFVRGFDRVSAGAGQGGLDRAFLYDSAGDDTLTADPASARLWGPGFDLSASGFARVDASSTAGGKDVATLTGSAGDDRYYAGPIEGQLIGPGFDLHAIGFASVTGSGGAGGADKAYLTGTQADDTLTASSARARLVGPGMDVTAEAFPWVMVSGGSCLGTDTANLADSAGNDVFESSPNSARLFGPNYSIRVENFAKIAATSAAGGSDKATFKDSAGDDRLDAAPGRARLTGSGFDNSALGFATIDVDGMAGGKDRATVTDSAGDDTLTAAGSSLTLTKTGLSLRLNGFESVSATATLGKNRKKLSAIDFALELISGWVS